MGIHDYKIGGAEQQKKHSKMLEKQNNRQPKCESCKFFNYEAGSAGSCNKGISQVIINGNEIVYHDFYCSKHQPKD